MCGIAGFFSPMGCLTAHAEVLEHMALAIHHRGPDDTGIWFDSHAGIGLAHKRLSIIDLSPGGRQPMSSVSGRYFIVYNGEIYNFLSLKVELENLGFTFKGTSDTEVLLSAIEQWGIEGALKRFVGMFAFALWDRNDRSLILARDRVGEKPLYYGQCGDTFLFGSELKALRKHPAWVGGICPEALNLFFSYTYIPAPYSIHPGIFKLKPGTFLRLRYSNAQFQETSHTYWSALEVAQRGKESPFAGSDDEAIHELEVHLKKVIRRQMISDVPLGAFLSGGIDSSTVVAMMQAQCTNPIKTFSVGFNEKGFDEAQHAKAIAKHLGTDHTELYVTDRDCLDVIPYLPSLYDEPFADSSQVPTCLLASLARQKVTVSLSGDGGDELFYGYDRYSLIENGWKRIAPFPSFLRKGVHQVVNSLPLGMLDVAGKILSKHPAGARLDLHSDRIRRMAELQSTTVPYQLNELMTSYGVWAETVTGKPMPKEAQSNKALWDALPCLPSHMMLLDLQRYLPDDILVKVDRAGMAASLETRMPLLDHQLIEFSAKLPLHLKRRDGRKKWLLKQVLYKHVPRSLVDRPKMGFGLPVDIWLRGPLRDWCEDLLGEASLQQSGVLNAKPIRQKWEEHLSGMRNWKYHIWPILIFQSWQQSIISGIK